MLRLIKNQEKVPYLFSLPEYKDRLLFTLDPHKGVRSNSVPIEEWENSKKVIAFDTSISGIPTFPSFYNDTVRKFRTRDRSFLKLPGFLFYYYRGRSILIAVVFKDLEKFGELKAFVSSEYLEDNPSHKTLLNKFVKGYGVKQKNISIKPEGDMDNLFVARVRVSLEDYMEKEKQSLVQSFIFINKTIEEEVNEEVIID